MCIIQNLYKSPYSFFSKGTGLCQPNSCSGNGKCVESLGKSKCNCNTGYTGEECEIST